ncbi:hypothetical protein AAZV13_04G100950 [Glycine max]
MGEKGFQRSMTPVSIHSISCFRGLKKERRCAELMSFLVHTEDCRDFIRMGPQESIQLCHKLRGTRIVKDNMRSTVEEQVAKFCILLVTMSIIKVCSALSS